MALANTDKLTSQLAMLPDNALRQMAQMHKNDPYVLPLIIAEDGRRKQLRMAGQAQQYRPQPKVADAQAAQVGAPLPEEVGIGMLPAPNMAQMADGGIAGYAEGGVARMSGGGVGEQAAFREFLRQMGISPKEYVESTKPVQDNLRDMFRSSTAAAAEAAPASAATQGATQTATSAGRGMAYELGRRAAPVAEAVKSNVLPVLGAAATGAQMYGDVEGAEGFYSDPNVSTLDKALQWGRSATKASLPYVGATVGSGVAPILGTATGLGLGLGASALIDKESEALREWRKANPGRAAAAAASAPATAPSSATPSPIRPADPMTAPQPDMQTYRRTGGDPGVGRRPVEKPPVAPGNAGTSMQSLDALYENLRKKYGPEAGQADPFAEQRKALTEAKTSERRQALEDFEKDVAARTPFGAEREKRLIAKEEKLGRDEEQLGGLALLEAGLDIMAGTSPYAAANIGAGAGVGLKAYKQGKKNIEDARDKLDDARSLIDEYRRNETELTKKERRGLQRDIRNAQTEGLESLLSGAEKMYGFAREDVKTMLGAAVTERAAHIKGGYELQAAGMRASAGQDQKLAALAQRTLTDIRNAAQKQFPYPTQNAQREKFVNEQLAQALQYNPDLAQYMGAAGGGGAPSAAPSFRYNQQTGQVEPVR